jgi:hypothetical protein
MDTTRAPREQDRRACGYRGLRDPDGYVSHETLVINCPQRAQARRGERDRKLAS